ncbi:MAG: hypothetical protein AB7N65_08325 [Vicinamibacterales bacterium]
MRRGWSQAAVGAGLVILAVFVLPGLAVICAYVALVLGSLAFVRAGLRPAPLTARAAVTALFLASAMVGPLAKSAERDAPADATGTHGTLIGVLRAVHAAELSYSQVNGYFDALECLLQAPCIPGVPAPPRYLSAEVVRQLRNTGYEFRFSSGPRAIGRRADDPVSTTAMTAYAITATPGVSAARQGVTRAYCSDASGLVFLALEGRVPAVEGGRCVDRSTPVP